MKAANEQSELSSLLYWWRKFFDKVAISPPYPAGVNQIVFDQIVCDLSATRISAPMYPKALHDCRCHCKDQCGQVETAPLAAKCAFDLGCKTRRDPHAFQLVEGLGCLIASVVGHPGHFGVDILNGQCSAVDLNLYRHIVYGLGRTLFPGYVIGFNQTVVFEAPLNNDMILITRVCHNLHTAGMQPFSFSIFNRIHLSFTLQVSDD